MNKKEWIIFWLWLLNPKKTYEVKCGKKRS